MYFETDFFMSNKYGKMISRSNLKVETFIELYWFWNQHINY